MANMFKPVKAKSTAQYLAALPEPRRTEIRQLDALMKKTVPTLKPYFAYNMIGYGAFPYRAANGKDGTWPVIALASQKNYISIYVCAVKNGKYIAELHKKDFPKASIGRSCIRIKKLADIDTKKLTVVLTEAARRPGFPPKK